MQNKTRVPPFFNPDWPKPETSITNNDNGMATCSEIEAQRAQSPFRKLIKIQCHMVITSKP